ncbi:Ctr copper transporter family protein [Microdochium nivale]|nr:Ctr copper transporter family protein [Microdochium nivale]
MDHSMPTTTAAAAAAATSPAMSMGGMGGGSGCKISMLWNWYTIDSCFIASTWRIRSEGMFAGSCIGVILLVMALEFLRRSVKEYDRFLLRKHTAPRADIAAAAATSSSKASSDNEAAATCLAVSPGYRPNVLEQAVRAFLHMCQFAVAYFIMLCVALYGSRLVNLLTLMPDLPCTTMATSSSVSSSARTSAASSSSGKLSDCEYRSA